MVTPRGNYECRRIEKTGEGRRAGVTTQKAAAAAASGKGRGGSSHHGEGST